MQALLEQSGLALVFINVLALSLGLPVPAMPTMILVGASFAMRDGQDAWLGCLTALLVSVCASLIGDLAWFAGGRRFGNRTLQSLCRLSLSRDTCMKKTERFYGRWGVRILAVAKFIPGLSLVSVPMAGAMRVRVRSFLAYDSFGAMLWAAVGLGLGALFSDEVGQLLALISRLGMDAILIALLALAAYIGWRGWRRWQLLRALDKARMTVDELYTLMQGETPPAVLDIRAEGYRDLEPFTIPGAHFVDDRKLDDILQRFSPEQALVIYCACPNEVSAAWLAKRLRGHQYNDVVALEGGLGAWREAGYAVDPLPVTGHAPAATSPRARTDDQGCQPSTSGTQA